MTPDPLLAKLSQFTPAAVGHAELLFAAGRASARTPWIWKATVFGSLAVNVLCVGLLLRSPEPPKVVLPEPAAVPVLPVAEPVAVPVPTPEPWSYQAMHAATDPDRLPTPEPVTGISHATKPLSVLSARSGEIE